MAALLHRAAIKPAVAPILAIHSLVLYDWCSSRLSVKLLIVANVEGPSLTVVKSSLNTFLLDFAVDNH